MSDGVEEGVAVTLEEGHVDVHAAAVFVRHGLGHEGSVAAVAYGHFLDHQAESHGVVRHGQRVGVAHVDLVLAGGHFVVAVLDADTHGLQGQYGVAAQVGGRVQGGQVEISAPVQHFRPFRVLEIEVLQFRADVEVVSHLRRPSQVALEDEAGVAFVGLPFGTLDVAEHPAHRVVLLGAPGQEAEGRRIGYGHHVALIDAGVSLNG